MDSREALRAAAAEAAKELEARRRQRKAEQPRDEAPPGRSGSAPPAVASAAPAAGLPATETPLPPAPAPSLTLPLQAAGSLSGQATPPMGSPGRPDTGSTMSLVSCGSACSSRKAAPCSGSMKPRTLFAQATPTPVANLRKWGPGSAPRRCPGLGTPTRRATTPPAPLPVDYAHLHSSGVPSARAAAAATGAGSSSRRGSPRAPPAPTPAAALAAGAAAGGSSRQCRNLAEGPRIAALVDLWESKHRGLVPEDRAEAAF